MTAELRKAMTLIVENVNILSHEEYKEFIDDLVCNLEVDLTEDENPLF